MFQNIALSAQESDKDKNGRIIGDTSSTLFLQGAAESPKSNMENATR